MPKRDEGELDMSDLGLLMSVNTPDYPGNKRTGQGLFEMTFDTGVIVYAPRGLFETMRFELPEKDQ